jgi:hypothetical protein
MNSHRLRVVLRESMARLLSQSGKRVRKIMAYGTTKPVGCGIDSSPEDSP